MEEFLALELLCWLNPIFDKLDVKWPGISKVNNFEFTCEGVKVWRVYQVGEGKLLPWFKFECKNRNQSDMLQVF